MSNVEVPGYFGVFGLDPLNVARNHIAIPGEGIRAIADHLNFIQARRPKRLAGINYRSGSISTSTSDTETMRFAFRTGPVTGEIFVEWTLLPNTSPADSVASEAYIVLETGLTGVGSSTTLASVFMSETNNGTITPSHYHLVRQLPQPVDPETLYRATVHLVNGMRVAGVQIWERPRLTLNTATDTSAVDPTGFYQGGKIYSAAMADLVAARAKIKTRCGKSLFTWTVPWTTAITRTTASGANILDQSVTTVTSASPGFPVVVANCHSYDTTNVPTQFYCYAAMAGGGTGKVEFKNAAGTLGSINVAGAAAWYQVTGVLDGTDASDKIDVHIQGDGAGALSLYAAGAFLDG